MQSPILYETTAFDANFDQLLTFNWNADQSRGSILNIYNNETNELIYTGTYVTMKLVHNIPANSLENGVCYNAILYIIDSDRQIISGQSNTIVFYCYSTPIFRFSNLLNGSIIENSSCEITLEYSQKEGELLAQYQLMLCDMSKTPIKTKGLQYITNEVNSINDTISGLEDNTSYYIRAVGKTLNGMTLDTDYILISVHYIQPSMFSYVELTNHKRKGYIYITSNLITLRAESNPPEDKLTFIDGTMVDLTQEGTYVRFDKDFDFSGDGQIAATYLGALVNLSMLRFGNDELNANLYYRQGKFLSQNNILKGYFELQIDFPFGHVIVASDYIDPILSNQLYSVWIIKKNNLYQIQYLPKEVA